MNKSGFIQVVDLWYDWTNGRNFNILQYQLGGILYDLEWNNGTSFKYTVGSDRTCSSTQLEIGILRPNWLDGGEYVGQKEVDGFLCNVWTKAEFITYYEDVLTNRPVYWVFFSGREHHVMTFEVGAALEDAKWQVPWYCFEEPNNATTTMPDVSGAITQHPAGERHKRENNICRFRINKKSLIENMYDPHKNYRHVGVRDNRMSYQEPKSRTTSSMTATSDNRMSCQEPKSRKTSSTAATTSSESGSTILTILILFIAIISFIGVVLYSVIAEPPHPQDPKPTQWPDQFHSIILMNNSGVSRFMNAEFITYYEDVVSQRACSLGVL
ncbi:glycosyl transferase [Tanacetum coccineum]